jgi:hypothetical protein
MNNTSYKNVAEIEPLEKLSNVVVGIATNDGFTIRGRLIKFTARELWLEKMSGDAVMIARTDINRLWRSHDCRRGSK